MDEFGMLRLEVDIPRQKIMAASMMIAEQYKPLVEEALQEAIQEIERDNSDMKAAIKARLKLKINEAILKNIETAINDVIRKSKWDFYKVTDRAMKELLNGM